MSWRPYLASHPIAAGTRICAGACWDSGRSVNQDRSFWRIGTSLPLGLNNYTSPVERTEYAGNGRIEQLGQLLGTFTGSQGFKGSNAILALPEAISSGSHKLSPGAVVRLGVALNRPSKAVACLSRDYVDAVLNQGRPDDKAVDSRGLAQVHAAFAWPTSFR